MSNIPLGRLGLPHDVGAAHAFLASDKTMILRRIDPVGGRRRCRGESFSVNYGTADLVQ